ncbi:MAG: YggS family pyridoxal phosphate-dependent enzyme [Halobacteria archaeon]|nr:YggS family pyridoxal phosphate-dependent enzyme [Halobacteria archaeon]
MSTIADRLAQVRTRITQAANAVGRDPASVNLLAVSKTHHVADLEAALAAGQTAFGESYLQDALPKIEAIGDRAEWHFIGPIQTNKTRQIATHFDWVHSVDRIKIAQRLNEQRPRELPPLNVCLQVNTSGEAAKAGIPLADTWALAEAVSMLPHLRLRGLMTIPAREQDAARQRQPFHQLRSLFEQLNASGFNLDTLSMGMSNDMEAAIAEGATLVRIGTAIFGPRRAKAADNPGEKRSTNQI